MSQPEIKVSFRCDDRIAGDEVGRIQRVYIHKNGHESNYNDGVDDENKEDKRLMRQQRPKHWYGTDEAIARQDSKIYCSST
ncbi:hypothetical protein PV328_007277, partial [Microctonus aethiopoides]